MFEYMFIIFGINCDKKIVSHFFSGLTLAIFSIFLIQIPITIKANENNLMLINKIFFAILMTSILMSYIFIKIKFEKIIQIRNEFKFYQTRSFVKQRNRYFSCIIATTFSITLTVISVMIVFNDLQYVEYAKDVSLGISFEQQIPVLNLYINSWIISIQFIYYDLNIKYYDIIRDFDNELERRISKPSINVIVMTQRTVLKISRFHWILKRNIDFIEYFIVINNISWNIILLLSLISQTINDTHEHKLIIINFILSNLYFLWTQRASRKTKFLRQKLVKYLNRWQTFGNEEKFSIELQVLKRIVRGFYKYEITDHFLV